MKPCEKLQKPKKVRTIVYTEEVVHKIFLTFRLGLTDHSASLSTGYLGLSAGILASFKHRVKLASEEPVALSICTR